MAGLRICVVGGGVVGLGSAYCLQELLVELGVPPPRVSLDVVAAAFPPDGSVTSMVAAGLWEPFADADTEHSLVDRTALSKPTWDFMQRLYTSPDAAKAGMQLMMCYLLMNPGSPPPPYGSTVHGFHQLTKEELALFPPHVKSGYGFSTFLCEQAKYLEWMMTKVKERGARFIRRKLNNLQEVYDSYDLVINCTGLGAMELLGDNELTPIRGQVIRVKAPWVKSAIMDMTTPSDSTDPTYILPNVDSCILGGTFELHDWETSTRQQTTRDIIARCAEYLPALKNAEVLSVQCGLRPARSLPRIEAETVHVAPDGREVMVVHNYGHGGNGVTMQMGCARRVCDLARPFILTKTSKARL